MHHVELILFGDN